MPNKQLISELVDDSTFKQLDQLEKSLDKNIQAFISAATAAKSYSDSIAGVTSIQQLTVKTQAAKKATDDMATSQDKIRLSEIKLETARRKAFDDFEKRIVKQANEEQKQLQREIQVRNARIKNIDNYNKKLAQQEAQQKRTTEQQEKAARAAAEAARPYAKLNVELNVLRQRAKDIGVEFGVNSKEFKNAANEVENLDKKLKEIDGKLGQRQRNVGNYPDQAGAAILGAGAALLSVGTAQKILADNAKIADSYSDVQRTAGLTEIQVDKLDKSLRAIDSRTGLNELIGIATIGGQLGVATEDLGGFTKAIDQLAVTLSGEIPGGAEAVATALGKINGVFKVQQKESTDTETALNKTGSAILKLGQVGLATGEYLQDFTLRTAGVAQTANISLPTILAYSAVLEETGNSAEVAGTAFNRLVGNLSSKRNQFFQIAKLADSTLTLKDFTNTINTDANKALQQFFAGLNKGGANLTSFTDLLDTLKIQGAASKNAIVALAQNQDLLNIRIGESVESYNAGSLSAEQFRIKNDNLAGSLDKINNELTKISTGRGFAAKLKEGADAVLVLLRETDKLVGSRSWQELTDRLFNPRGLLGGFSVGAQYDKLNSLTDAFDQNIGVLKSTGNKQPATKSEALRNFRETREAALSALTAYNTLKNAVTTGELKDTGGDVERYKNLAELLNQKAIGLKNVYNQTKEIAKAPAIDISTALGGDKKSESARKKAEASEFKRIKLLSENYASEEALTIASLSKKYEAGMKDAEDTINFENDKFNAVADAVAKRQALYRKDSIEYKKLEKEKTKAGTEAQEAIAKAIKDQLSKDDKQQADAAVRRVKQIQSSENEELTALSEKYNKGEITQEDYEKSRLAIMRKYSRLILAEEVKNVQALIDVQKSRGVDTTEQEAKLAELKLKISKEVTDKQIDDNKRFQDQIDSQFEQEKQVAEKRKELQQAVGDLGIAIVNGFFDNQRNKLEEEAEAIDIRKEKDIKDVEDSVLTEEEKANKIALINARAQSQKDVIERKQKDLEVRNARFQKVASILSIGISVSESIAKITAAAAVLNAIIPGSGIPALAQIPYVIGVGAAQIGAILATPIPKFRDGGDMPFTGIAQFGEEGRELRINPDGTTEFTPETTTLGLVEKGTKFISSPETKKLIASKMFMPDLPGSEKMDLTPIVESNNQGTAKIVKAIKSNSGNGTVITKMGWFKTQNEMQKINDYFKRNS